MRARPLAALFLLSACTSSRLETVKKTITLDSVPPGAEIIMATSNREVSLGVAPAQAELEMVTKYVDWNPWSLVLAGSFCGPTAAFSYLGTRDTSGSVGRPMSIVAAVGTGIVCLVTAADSLITAIDDGDKEDTYYKLGAPTFSAELQGHQTAKIALLDDEVPPDAPLRFKLKVREGSPPIAERETPVESWVLAVFELTAADPNAQPIVGQLTDYLSTRLAETGRYRIVPREQLRRALVEQKKESYGDCIDESCQIELGKAVAAQLSLRTQLIRVGAECALSATMYDLKLEATSSGASVRTPCDVDKLMDGVDVLVDKLAK